MPRRHALLAMLVAVTFGYSMIRHAGRMMHEGVGLEEGGGWTALILAEFMIAMGGVAGALY
jgi:hypothetical protein